MICTRPDVPQAVWSLIEGACEDSLTSDELRELESQLLGHRDRQRALLDYCGMHADLFLTVGIAQAVEQVRTKIEEGPGEKTLPDFADDLSDTRASLDELLNSARQLPVGATCLPRVGPRGDGLPRWFFLWWPASFTRAFALVAWNLHSPPKHGDSAMPATVAVEKSATETRD